MSLAINTSTNSGRSLVGTIRQVNADGSLGDYWNAATNQFGAVVSFANRSISLTELTGNDIGHYTGNEPDNLASYTGLVIVSVHDTGLGNRVIGAPVEAWLLNGTETSPRSDATEANQLTIISLLSGIVPTPVSPDRINQNRTWWISVGSEDMRAPQQVRVSQSSQVTLAMDFSKHLNPGTSIATVSTVEDVSGNGLVPTDLLASKDGQQAHFTVSSLSPGVRYELKATVATTDGQVLTGRGYLVGEQ